MGNVNSVSYAKSVQARPSNSYLASSKKNSTSLSNFGLSCSNHGRKKLVAPRKSGLMKKTKKSSIADSNEYRSSRDGTDKTVDNPADTAVGSAEIIIKCTGSDASMSSISEVSSINKDKGLGETFLYQDTKVTEKTPLAMRVLRQWLHHKNDHHITKMMELTSPSCYFHFVDAEASMPSHEFYTACEDTNRSFPNISFYWSRMKLKKITDNGNTVKIVVKDYYGVGKHTGEPLGFGPYDPIPATGLEVRDENIEFTFTLSREHGKEGTFKIVNAKINAFGQMVGPPGFYSKIGGLIF